MQIELEMGGYQHYKHYKEHRIVGVEVLTAAAVELPVVWFVTPCSLAEFYQSFRTQKTRR
jgi:hypothetical protein